MQVRVTRFLNIRTEVPDILPNNNPGFLKPNDAVRIVETVRGVMYKDSNIWYRIEQGGFVWSGAIEQDVLSVSLDWWHRAYGIVDAWDKLDTWGELATVAVFDSGADLTDTFLDRTTVLMRSIVPDDGGADRRGHGTAVIGVLAGDRMHNFGVAPMCRIESVKLNDTGDMTAQQLMEAIQRLPDHVDIVNISQAFSFDADVAERLREVFNSFSEKVFVCGAGNSRSTNLKNNLPACLSKHCENVISVAGVNSAGVASSFASVRSDALSLAAPSENIAVINIADKSKLYPDSGTSYAAPLISGLIALGKSCCRAKGSMMSSPEIAKLLIETVDPKNDQTRYGAGIVNPVRFADALISKVKSTPIV